MGGKHKQKIYSLKDLGVNGRIILKWIIERLVGVEWTEFLWGRRL
jgi:hypothetical protein